MHEKYTYDPAKKWNYFGRLLLRVLMSISAIVWISFIGYSLATYFIGFTFFFWTAYGWEAVGEAFLFIGLFFWYVFLAGMGILIGGSIYFRVSRKNYDREEEKAYAKHVVRIIYKPVLAAILIAILYSTSANFLNSTYSGAKIQVLLGVEKSNYRIKSAEEFLDSDEVYYVEKNGEVIYVYGMENIDKPDFLNDLYYVTYSDRTGAIAENSERDVYAFFDEDGIYIGVYVVMGDQLEFFFSEYDLEQTPVAYLKRLKVN